MAFSCQKQHLQLQENFFITYRKVALDRLTPGYWLHHRHPGVLSFYDSFILELCHHLQHVDADLLRIIIQTGTDDTEAVWCQYPTMQFVSLVLLVLLIFLIRYLLHGNLHKQI